MRDKRNHVRLDAYLCRGSEVALLCADEPPSSVEWSSDLSDIELEFAVSEDCGWIGPSSPERGLNSRQDVQIRFVGEAGSALDDEDAETPPSSGPNVILVKECELHIQVFSPIRIGLLVPPPLHVALALFDTLPWV